jgi:hypothetical protein
MPDKLLIAFAVMVVGATLAKLNAESVDTFRPKPTKDFNCYEQVESHPCWGGRKPGE